MFRSRARARRTRPRSSQPYATRSRGGWESLEMARAFRKEGQALYLVESNSIFRADQSWLTLGVQNAIASLSAHRYWSGAPSGTPRWEILLAPPICVMERID